MDYIMPGGPGTKTDPLKLVSGGDTPPPPPVPPGIGVPDLLKAKNRVDTSGARQKRGRRSTILTGDEGVGSSPLGFKTLVGS